MTITLKAIPKMAEDLGRTTPAQRAEYEKRMMVLKIEVLMKNQRTLLAEIERLST